MQWTSTPFYSFIGLIMCLNAASSAAPSDVNARVNDLLPRMTLQEKIGQLVQINNFNGTLPESLAERLRQGRVGSMLNEGNPSVSTEIQRIAMEESRLGIPLIMGRDVIHGFRTIFPIPLAQAATWDPNLVQACAQVAAREAAEAGYQWTFAPMMDICRDPRWGRIAEGFGEDPYLASQFAAAMVKGFQGRDLADPHTIAACAKHFVGYGAAEGGRDYDTANIPEGLLRDVYLPPFKAAVDAGVATVMSSFNEINGIPSSGNPFILRQILRREWTFSGFVVSDWRATAEMIEHGFCRDLNDVAQTALRAGVDMEMQSTAYQDHLAALIQTGQVPESLLDEAVRAILGVKARLGLFERPFPYSAQPSSPPRPESLHLAQTIATESVVLLKNQNQCLPLAASKLTSVAVIGPLADDPYEVLGTWNRDGHPEDTVTPLAAIKSLAGKAIQVHYAQGIPTTRSRETAGFQAAVTQARQSDVILLFVGEEAILSGEAHSRAYLDLPGCQNALVEALAQTGKPLVLIVLAGRPLTIGEVSQHADAVLYAWHPGTQTGPALADLLFGVTSPSGKLPITFPKTEGQIPVYYAHKNTGRPPQGKQLTMIDDIPVHAAQSSLGDAARYLDIGYKPLYPFGYGLSYTHFQYDQLNLSATRFTRNDTLTASIRLSNTGARDAAEVVQLYTRDLVASVTRPVRELKAFKRIFLKAGQAKTVTFHLPISRLGFHNQAMDYVVEPGQFQLWIGPDSDSGLRGQFTVLPPPPGRIDGPVFFGIDRLNRHFASGPGVGGAGGQSDRRPVSRRCERHSPWSTTQRNRPRRP